MSDINKTGMSVPHDGWLGMLTILEAQSLGLFGEQTYRSSGEAVQPVFEESISQFLELHQARPSAERLGGRGSARLQP